MTSNAAVAEIEIVESRAVRIVFAHACALIGARIGAWYGDRHIGTGGVFGSHPIGDGPIRERRIGCSGVARLVMLARRVRAGRLVRDRRSGLTTAGEQAPGADQCGREHGVQPSSR